jgi:hypothetical protein
MTDTPGSISGPEEAFDFEEDRLKECFRSNPHPLSSAEEAFQVLLVFTPHLLKQFRMNCRHDSFGQCVFTGEQKNVLAVPPCDVRIIPNNGPNHVVEMKAIFAEFFLPIPGPLFIPVELPPLPGDCR